MKTRFLKTMWGVDGTAEQALTRIQAAGYDGVEAVLGWVLENQEAVRNSGLELAVQVFPDRVDGLKADLDKALGLGAVLIGAQAGRDWWPDEVAMRFWEGVLGAVADYPIPVCFETHRGKQLFDPKSTVEVLRRFPDLKILADFSHWTCVCESMLHDQEESLSAVIPHVHYVHARVGHEEGPQVPDPRADRWQYAVERFEGLWDRMRAAAQTRGDAVFRVDPEFGPPNYLWTEPVSGQPLADLWDVCAWMKDRLKSRWEGRDEK